MAVAVSVNAKMRRTGICGATETLLCDRSALPLLAQAVAALSAAGCAEIRCCEDSLAFLRSGSANLPAEAQAKLSLAHQSDWTTEYLAPIISVKLVGGVEEAVQHINTHGSHHTEAILSTDLAKVTSRVQFS